MEYPVDPQGQRKNRFPDIASLWDRAVGDVLVALLASHSQNTHPWLRTMIWSTALRLPIRNTPADCRLVSSSVIMRAPSECTMSYFGFQGHSSILAMANKPIAVQGRRKNWNVPKACAVFEFTSAVCELSIQSNHSVTIPRCYSLQQSVVAKTSSTNKTPVLGHNIDEITPYFNTH
ncbi:hypothetical protein BP00DRAFT_411493 [Aspergillus indologenus CBS 114.80]|uniref:Uncharacterized protein n=1 Tax=Aspergillus indologenus CBS 114.80 TaxID=1450541 RepID=A0A2V5II80_9EURO|nr:hypothetical protein BP00DRAFT_411493 [Aspergillus indologenus CBS 114.80]